ncbi:MAG: class I SAM-dependent methyltransferase [Gemmatimonadales bacterium]
MRVFEPTDVRHASHSARLEIGFAHAASGWANAKAEFSDGTLSICGHPVMEDWEAPYMRRLGEIASSNGGVVLEVGFGMGIAATFIQSHGVRKHIVVEANRDVFRCLEEFATRYRKSVIPLFGFWQDVMPSIADESVDGILFDTYPLNENEVHCNHYPFFEHAYRVLKKGGVLTYYSDEISDFSHAHRNLLRDAGFEDIAHELCRVSPPQTCVYWHGDTIVAPIITK